MLSCSHCRGVPNHLRPVRLTDRRKCDLSIIGELIHGDPAEDLVHQGQGVTSGSSNETLEFSRSVFERDNGRIDKKRFENVIKDAS